MQSSFNVGAFHDHDILVYHQQGRFKLHPKDDLHKHDSSTYRHCHELHHSLPHLFALVRTGL